jgi:hypothetical protein
MNSKAIRRTTDSAHADQDGIPNISPSASREQNCLAAVQQSTYDLDRIFPSFLLAASRSRSAYVVREQRQRSAFFASLSVFRPRSAKDSGALRRSRATGVRSDIVATACQARSLICTNISLTSVIAVIDMPAFRRASVLRRRVCLERGPRALGLPPITVAQGDAFGGAGHLPGGSKSSYKPLGCQLRFASDAKSSGVTTLTTFCHRPSQSEPWGKWPRASAPGCAGT